QQVHQCADSVCHTQSHAPADKRDQQRLKEKLLQDSVSGRAQSFADTDLACPFTDRNHHDVHHAQSAQQQSDNAHCSQEILHAVCHLAKRFCLLHRVPDGTGFFVFWIKVMHPPQRVPDLVFAGFMLFHRLRRNQQLVECSWRSRRLIREIAAHGSEGNEYFVYVPTVVAGILFLLGHHSNHGVRKIVQVERLVHGIASRKELLAGIAPQENDSPRFTLVIPVVETSFSDIESSDVGKWGKRAGYCKGGIVVIAVGADVVLL